MSTYLGIDVLAFHPNRLEAADETFDRRIRVLDPETGKITVDEESAAPAPTRTVSLVCFTRAEIKQVRDFLDARRGRVNPFWLPSYQRDLVLVADMGIGEDTAEIEWVGYSADVYPQSRSRRHVAFYEPHLAMEFHQVTDATDAGGSTELIELSPVLSRAAPAASTLISYLKLVRLEDDEAEISWRSTQAAEITFRVREVPNEIPGG